MFISNVTIKNAIIIANNIKVIFVNCNLHNVKIADDYVEDLASLFHIQIAFINTLFYCQHKNKVDWYGIQLKNSSVVEIILKKSSYYNCELNIYSRELLLTIMNSYFYHVTIEIVNAFHVNIQTSSVIYIFQTSFSIEKSILSLKKILLFLQNPFVMINNCTFTNTYVEILQAYVHTKQELFLVKITHSLFINASKNGNGGALLISSQIKNSTVMLGHNTFLGNKAKKISSMIPGRGGAVFIEGNSLFLKVHFCMFERNLAKDQGSSLYTSEGVTVEINNSTFVLEVTKPYMHFMMATLGKIHRFVAKFVALHNFLDLYNLDLKLFTVEQASGEMLFSVQCPPWHRHIIQYQVDETGRAMQNSVPIKRNIVYVEWPDKEV